LRFTLGAEGGMVKYHTAEMSHEQIRSAVQQALDTKYQGPPPEPTDYDKMPWAMEVYDDHVIHSGGPGKGLFKQKYTLGKAGECELIGDPEAVEMGFVTKASMQLAASKVTTSVEEAQELMTELCDKNPLMASLKDSPNTHLVIFDLTSIGKPSNHEGQFHYQLAKSGLKAALPTLISKPIHVTAGLDGHFTAGKDPVAIGVFLGGVVIDQPDGSQVLRAIGTLWDDDFPDLVNEIKEKRADLGASYEIAYLAASASRLGGKVIEIGKYEFSGGAILYKSAAAHRETQLLMADKDTSQTFDVLDDEQLARLVAWLRGGTSFTQADTLSYKERTNLSDSDFALVQTVDGRKVRRFPIQDEAHRKNAWSRLPQAKNLSDAERSELATKIINKAKAAGDDWAKGYTKSGGEWTKGTQTKGGASMKYKGIPEDVEAVVDALIATAIKDLEGSHKANMDRLVTEKAAVEAKLQAAMPMDDEGKPAFLKKKATELEAQVATLTTEVERLKPIEAKATEMTAAFEVAKASLATAQQELDKIAGEQKLAATITALKADYGLTDAQIKEEKRAPLIAKQAAGKEPLSIEEWKQLMTGAQVPGARGEIVPLFAGGGDPGQGPKATPAEIAKNFPNAAKKTFR
jgi:hypothetical protein